jgi:hypothetical protein
MKRALVLSTAVILGVSAIAFAQTKPTPSPAGAEAYFIAPKDGETVTSPVTVKFGLKGMGIAPAGITMENTGHHHLVVDGDAPPAGTPVPTDPTHIHYGKGQTEASVELKPGKHTLLLVLGDFAHAPHNPPVVSKKITVTVK